ncbi:hypothetical protein EI534_12855 [Pseudomonas frederiksbergensis]|nr:hypothetical protein [Pseudomonas frederiksbergensis]
MGASLLAMAVYQPTVMLDVMAPSRAGSLPQLIGGVHILVFTTKAPGIPGKITTLVLVSLSIVAFTTHRYWHVMGS